MSWVKGKSPGWAAFNLKQQNNGLQDDPEPFPPMSTALSSLPPRENLYRVNGRSGRSFSSASLPSADSLTLPESFGAKKTILGDSSIQSGKKVVEETADVLAFWKLKELHSWADISLIVDIMEAVNNNFNEASTLLKTMVSSDKFEINNEMSTLELHSSNDLLSVRGKSHGAAGNLKTQTRGFQDEIGLEPLPPISSGLSSLPPRENLPRVNGHSGGSFTSAPLPSGNSLTLAENYGAKKTVLGNSSTRSGKKVVEETTDVTFWKLKELHSWADFSLIVNIMEAVNNNFNEASTLLKTMVSSDKFEINNEMSTLELHSSNDLSSVRGKSHGAAGNLKTQTRGCQDEIGLEPLPPISSGLSSLPPRENLPRVNGHSGRSFTSAPLPSGNSLTLAENYGAKKTVLGNSSTRSGKKVVEETTDVTFWKLKELHSWADFSLIVNIMEAVNNNFNEASTLLKTMVSSDKFEINNEMSTLELHSSNDLSSVRGKSHGAAGNLKTQTRGFQDEIGLEPLPSISSGLSSLPPRENLPRVNGHSGRSFTSAPLPSGNSLTLAENYGAKKTVLGNSSTRSGKKVVEETTDVTFWKLKELHSRADFSLIVDIMEAVNNNFNEASTLLKIIVSSDNFDINNEMSALGLHSSNDQSFNGKNDVSISLEKMVNIPILSSTLKDVHQNNNACQEDDTKLIKNNYYERNFFHDVGDPKLALGPTSVPIEPEWEEDDIYLSHRKDAIAMMRSASQHSRAATNAYLKKDHASAKYHSSRAQEQWLAAKKLNDKAANEILRTRNSKNGLWKLDLHGLHAAEAVQALQENLLKIETQYASNRSLSPKKADRKGFLRASSLESLNCIVSKLNKESQSPSSRHRPTSLEVITGIGKHSRGEAALPKAVTSFLSENGYRFEQLRPGTISVRPKFRR